MQGNNNRDAYKQTCGRGLNRGNKLYEGHRLVLHEHQETLVVSRKTEHLHGNSLTVVQEIEEQEEIIHQAINEKRQIEIAWEQQFNPLKLSADEYAIYLHSALNPRTMIDTEVRTEQATVIAVLPNEGMLKCKLQSGSVCLIPVKNMISIQLI